MIKVSVFSIQVNYFGNLTIEELSTDTYQLHIRDKFILDDFYLTEDIEKYGSAYKRIRNEILSYSTMKIKYKEFGCGFLLELHMEKIL